MNFNQIKFLLFIYAQLLIIYVYVASFQVVSKQVNKKTKKRGGGTHWPRK